MVKSVVLFAMLPICGKATGRLCSSLGLIARRYIFVH